MEEASLALPQMDTSLIGPPLEMIFDTVASGVSPTQRALLVQEYRARYRVHTYKGSRVFRGIPPLLQRLGQQGVRLFVATNKPLDVTTGLLARKKLLPFFTGVICRDSLPGKQLSKREMLEMLLERHRIAPTDAVMIGDSTLDMAGGRAAGMTTLAALYGYGNSADLLSTGPDLMVEDEDWTRVRSWPCGLPVEVGA